MEKQYCHLFAGREDVIEIDAAEGPEDTFARQVVEKLQEHRAKYSKRKAFLSLGSW